MFVVTGTPRSATGYASMLFTAANVPCAHEKTFRPKTNVVDLLDFCEGDDALGESSWMAWLFLSFLPRSTVVLHTVRNPWAVVDSLAHRNDLLPRAATLHPDRLIMRRVIGVHCPEVERYDTAIDRAAAMVVYWNQRIEAVAKASGLMYRRYRVEDVNADVLSNLLALCDIQRSPMEIERALKQVPNDVNGGRQIDYKVKVTNPDIVAFIKKIDPTLPPVIGKVLSRRTPMSSDDVEADMDTDLRARLNELAARYGYERINEISKVRESSHGTVKCCTTV